MRSSKSNRILRRAAIAGAALSLAGAPAALAIPADQGPGGAADSPHLTPAQLRAIDGHEPVDAPVVSTQPPAATPLKASTSGSWSPDAWMIVLAGAAVAVLAAGGLRLATHRPLLPARRTRVGA